MTGRWPGGRTTPAPTTSTTRPTPTTPVPGPSTSAPATGAAPALRVSGNKLLTASGVGYRLLGVNRSGGEFACIQGNGIWDGPMDAASVDVMRSTPGTPPGART